MKILLVLLVLIKKRVYSVKVFEQVRKTNEKQILKKFEN